MVEAELFSYDGCSSCRSAEALLRERGTAVKKREFFKDRMSGEEIAALFQRIDATPKEMLATRSRPYQALGLAVRTLSDDDIVGLMAEHPALIRRPVVVVGERGLAGFNRAAIERLLAEAEKGEHGNA
jgi:arsenate reductase (glutaredoxin)